MALHSVRTLYWHGQRNRLGNDDASVLKTPEGERDSEHVTAKPPLGAPEGER